MRIGETSSGKEIRLFFESEHAERGVVVRGFSDVELFEALAATEYVAVRELRKSGESEIYWNLVKQVDAYRTLLHGKMEGLKEQLGLATIFDILGLGKTIASSEFLD